MVVSVFQQDRNLLLTEYMGTPFKQDPIYSLTSSFGHTAVPIRTDQ